MIEEERVAIAGEALNEILYACCDHIWRCCALSRTYRWYVPKRFKLGRGFNKARWVRRNMIRKQRDDFWENVDRIDGTRVYYKDGRWENVSTGRKGRKGLGVYIGNDQLAHYLHRIRFDRTTAARMKTP